MNVSTLTKVATSSRASEIVFKHLAGRERAAWTSNLGRLYNEVTANGTNLSREAFNKVFEDLQKAGAGTIVLGRRGGANRFVWSYNFRDAASQTLSSLQAVKKTAAKALEAKPQAPAASSAKAEGTVIQITLPNGVSIEDIKALIELAKTAGSK